MLFPAETRSPSRLAFVLFLRTGRLMPDHPLQDEPAPLETKFNPSHDPKDGRFTSGPGGGSSEAKDDAGQARSPSFPNTWPSDDSSAAVNVVSDGVYRLDDNSAPLLHLTAGGPITGIGGNSGAFLDPMTLDDVFPDLSRMPGGTILSAADNFLNLTAPRVALTSELSLEYSNALISQIRAIDPSFRYDSFGVPNTFDGQMQKINDLRWDRAAAIYRATGNDGPLQFETLRFLQDRTDAAYNDALAAAKTGRLRAVPTEPVAIGNYIDRTVKAEFRDALNARRLSAPTGEAVRVSGREYDSSESDLSYTVPDARVGGRAFDITIAPKTLSTPQIRGFFRSDFKPDAVVIVRPRQLGLGSTYIITRPEK